MGKIQKQWAIRERARLIKELGGKCAKCGTIENLEFDCIIPQGDKHHRYDTSHRMSFYRQQFAVSNLQILCTKHNSEKADKEYQQVELIILLPKSNDNPF